MKKIAMALSLFTATTVMANTNEKKADHKIEKVTVFLKGAQVYESGNFSVPQGNSIILFEGVSPYIDQNSLQARGVGDFTILDVRFEVIYPQPDKIEPVTEGVVPPEILRKMKLLGDSIQQFNYQLEDVMTMKRLYESEKTMLLNNGMIKGTGKVNDSLELFKAAMLYYHDRMTLLNSELTKLTRKEREINHNLTGMNARLGELQNWQQKNKLKSEPPKGPIYRISVQVSADKAVLGKLEVNYLVSQAGWIPSYDIRAKDLNAPVDLSYKAQVYQTTGVDWTSVPLTLSTANPYNRQQKPELQPWYISYYDPYQRRQQADKYKKDMEDNRSLSKASVAAPSSGAGEAATMQMYLDETAVAKTGADFTVQSQNMITAEYKISLPYTIKSGGESYMISVSNKQLKSSYYLAIVPKLDNNAFLVANITDWEDLNLIPATARIYYDGTFVGNSFIDPMAMMDTLKLALGRDNNVSAVRKQLKDKEKNKVIGDSKVVEAYFEINIRNAHPYSVDIVLEDQVPISKNDDIKVEDIDLGKAEKNTYTGILTWRTKIKAGSSEKFSFGYRIKHDKNRNVNLAAW